MMTTKDSGYDPTEKKKANQSKIHKTILDRIPFFSRSYTFSGQFLLKIEEFFWLIHEGKIYL